MKEKKGQSTRTRTLRASTLKPNTTKIQIESSRYATTKPKDTF